MVNILFALAIMVFILLGMQEAQDNMITEEVTKQETTVDCGEE